MKYQRFTLYYMDGWDEREVFFFTIEAAAMTVARLHEIGMKVSVHFKGEVIL